MTQKITPFLPLSISGAGACCSLGMNLTSVDCALRARIDQFQHGDFYDQQNEPLRIAQLKDDTSRGATRLATWCSLAITECIDQAYVNTNQKNVDLTAVPLLLLAAERERPHSNDNFYRDIFDSIQQQLRIQTHESSRIIPAGRAGIGFALQLAQTWLATGAFSHVLVAGVDSYLDNYTINYYLGHDRLRTTNNSDGFIPGEAAAAVLLQLHQQHATTQLSIRGVGIEQERTQSPSRAQAFSQAVSVCTTQSAIPLSHYENRFSDQNGESFFAREAAHGLARLGTDGLKKLETYTIADCTGEIGAASAPLMLAWASRLLTKNTASSNASILHLANDDGLRTAIAIATTM